MASGLTIKAGSCDVSVQDLLSAGKMLPALSRRDNTVTFARWLVPDRLIGHTDIDGGARVLENARPMQQ
jgi:hypothetical protein